MSNLLITNVLLKLLKTRVFAFKCALAWQESVLAELTPGAYAFVRTIVYKYAKCFSADLSSEGASPGRTLPSVLYLSSDGSASYPFTLSFGVACRIPDENTDRSALRPHGIRME